MEEPDPQVSQVAAYQELDQAWYDLSSRGMHQAARWVAEQLNSFDPELLQPATQAAQEGALKPLRTDNTDRTPQYMLARQHFDFKVRGCFQPSEHAHSCAPDSARAFECSATRSALGEPGAERTLP